MASKQEVLEEMTRQGFTYNEVSEIFDEGDIASEKLYEEAGIEDFGSQMAAYLGGDSIEIVSIRNAESVNFAKLTAEQAVTQIADIMDRFYRDL